MLAEEEVGERVGVSLLMVEQLLVLLELLLMVLLLQIPRYSQHAQIS